MSSVIRVVVADDEPAYRNALQKTLTLMPECELLKVCNDGQEALEFCIQNPPDVLLTDINMPRMNGIELIRRLLKQEKGVMVVVLTVNEDEDTIFDAIRAGAIGYLLKTSTPQDVIDAIRLAQRGEAKITPRVAAKIITDFGRVKEEEEEFNLIKTLSNLTEYLGQQAGEKGVDFITDFPADPIRIRGLEARLAQVFVNLITNAISFCGEGDAVRIWARKRENRVLVVVEDTGPGIPEAALTKVFKRFYSERPQDFGNHSGLGLAISKQIVEAHGGVIWAENIRPTNADRNSPPLGARFVVGLPL